MMEGRLTVPELEQRVSEGALDTVVVGFTDLYGRLMGKRYDARFFLDAAVAHGAHACDYLFTVDVGMNPVPGYGFANWTRGYGDVHLVPDLETLRVASWLDRTAIVLCDVADRDGHGNLPIAPRSVLAAQTKRAADEGFTAMAASELEFYLFDSGYRDATSGSVRDLAPAGWVIEDYHILQGTRLEPFVGDVRRHLAASGIPVETSKGEWGLGQHELNLRYAAAVEMADRHVLYKQCIKELADAAGRSVTFMAKLTEDRAGSSCHVHMSLARDGRNAFPGSGSLSGIACSDEFRWFLGGWMKRLPEMMVFYAPTVNSYKRYQSASWAPTRIAWSYDNRTAGFRVVGAGESLRIECRVPGADCNPYLAFAAALASGLDGIENQIEPPPMHEGDVYAADEVPAVATSLAAATEAFESSEFARRAFGGDVVEHYAHFFRSEHAAFESAVTDWERARYFEQI